MTVFLHSCRGGHFSVQREALGSFISLSVSKQQSVTNERMRVSHNSSLAAFKRALHISQNNKTKARMPLWLSSAAASLSTSTSNSCGKAVIDRDEQFSLMSSSSSSSPLMMTPESPRSTSTTNSSSSSPFSTPTSSPTTPSKVLLTDAAVLTGSSPFKLQQRQMTTATTTLQNSSSTTTAKTSSLHQPGASDSSMIAANDRMPKHQQQQSRAFSTNMKDEYGSMTDEGDTYICKNFVLENGYVFDECQLRYQTYGTLNADRSNVLVVCHALTGNASLHSWWGDLLGEGKAFDTSKYFVVCCNILGSCYGSTSPTSIDPKTDKPYGKSFPDVSVQDTVRLQLLLLQEELGVSCVKCVIGGSFGGMQAVEFAVQAGSDKYSKFSSSKNNGTPFVRSVVPIACGSHHTAWQIAISEVQRQAIYADSLWEPDPFKAMKGLSVARQIGMISYRTADGYQSKFGREIQGIEDQESDMRVYGSDARWQVKSYLEYQGEKFLSRFDPVTYVKMTEQMDSHNVARGRGDSIDEVLSTVKIPALVMGIDSDVLYPLSQQKELASQLPNGELRIIASADGHDGFLLEQEQVARHITEFLDSHE